MNVHVLPSLVFDTRILENGMIQIPELKNKINEEIHIVIYFKDNEESHENTKSFAGALKRYANPSLIENEKEMAWSDLKDE